MSKLKIEKNKGLHMRIFKIGDESYKIEWTHNRLALRIGQKVALDDKELMTFVANLVSSVFQIDIARMVKDG